MSWATVFGLDNIGSKSVQEAHAAVNDALVKAEPILTKLANLLGGICHGLLDRFEVDIKIKLNPVEKAQLANPPQ